MTEQTPDLDPKTFDLDGWLTGAKLPERSVTVYGRADLVARADELQKQIELAEAAAEDMSGERAIGELSEAARLREEYAAVLEGFSASKLVIRVRAIPDSVATKLDAAEKAKDFPPEDRYLHEIAASAVSPKMTVEQVVKLREAIGTAQTIAIMAAVRAASNALPAVSPDFLPRASGRDSGRE